MDHQATCSRLWHRVFGTLLRMVVLFVASGMALAQLLAGLLLEGLQDLRA